MSSSKQMNFGTFASAIAVRWAQMVKNCPTLFRVNIDKRELWAAYLDAYPDGTNPIFRTNREYDCNYCRRFVYEVGNVVAVQHGKMVSIWDINIGDSEPVFQVVADKMKELITSRPIKTAFYASENFAGSKRTFNTAEDMPKFWDHFYVSIPHQYVRKAKDIPSLLSQFESSTQVFGRAISELTLDSIDTVLELVAQKSLYRGGDYQNTLEQFRKHKNAYLAAKDAIEQNVIIWTSALSLPASITHIRNSAIGTLLIDLDSGMDLEDAVRRFEAMVAPTNYKRPTALVTPRMVERAKQKITDLGLESALYRRFASLSDISVNDVLFADRGARKQMISDDPFASLGEDLSSKRVPKNLDRVETIGIEDFIKKVLPTASSIEVMMKARHEANLVSLIAPVDPTAGQLTPWNNNFTWAYAGNVTDSIKERVKAAGGKVDGAIRVSLSWYNYDDLDLHVIEKPYQGRDYEVSFGTRYTNSPRGGKLDVDMNAGSGQTREAVENIVYNKTNQLVKGEYEIWVHNYSRRENIDLGFMVELEILGEVQHFTFTQAVPAKVHVATMIWDGKEMKVKPVIASSDGQLPSKTVWNVNTESFQRVSALMLSPNFWDGNQIGNRHYFFMLDGCKNDTGKVRGFFNEFLRPELNEHRKVFEVVGERMKTDEGADKQLSGLGFSDTKREELIVRVSGSTNRMLKVLI